MLQSFFPMDASTSSSINRALSCTEPSGSAEESGWTTYFDDFFASQKREEESGDFSTYVSGGNSYCHGGGSSMVFDATSHAACKFRAATVQDRHGSRKTRLSSRERKPRSVVDDDPLEDTATSPATTPKEMDVGCEKLIEEARRDELGCTDESANECIDIKKKGLGFVPFSMFVDYLS